jgi:hypothetical protein
MPKTFYTERDIEDLLRQGVKSLIVDDDVVLTDLAYERARRSGLQLLRSEDRPPAAPVRPYIAAGTSATATGTKAAPAAGAAPSASELHQRVYQAALSRLGDSVDPQLLNVIVQRVLASINLK